MTERAATVANLNACFDSLTGLLGQLSDDEWRVQSLCPDWDVFAVVAHLASVEHVLDGWLPAAADEMPPFEKAGAFVAETSDAEPAELRRRLDEILERRRAQLDELTDEQFELPSLTPAGAGTYGRFLQIREFDFWVHEQDIRVPLDRPGFTGGDPADMALDEIHRSFGYIAGKRIGLPDGESIRVHLTGPVQRDICAVVEGRARVVDSVEDPLCELITDSLTFSLLACGRIDPQEPIEDGRVHWEGDDEWGERAARNLRFTM